MYWVTPSTSSKPPKSSPRKRYSAATIRQIRSELAGGASLMVTARKWGVSARYVAKLRTHPEVRRDAAAPPPPRVP